MYLIHEYAVTVELKWPDKFCQDSNIQKKTRKQMFEVLNMTLLGAW